jgi:hypothetical protein
MIRASRVCRGVCKCGLYCRKPQNFGDLTTPSSQQHRAIGVLTIAMSSRIPSRRLGQTGT